MRWLRFSGVLVSALAAQGKGSISGTVVNALTGAPLNKVRITAESTSVTSDSEGHFMLADLPPGQYRLRGTRNGYLETTGKPITLEAGQKLKDVRFKMAPFGVIAGTVRDDDGEPQFGKNVLVSRVRYENGLRRVGLENQADSDDLGQYRIPNLAPGRYYVSVEKDPSPARSVEVGAGERVAGVDIILTHPKTVRVTGHATFPAGTQAQNITLRTGDDALAFGVDTPVAGNGDFEFAAVPPGVYTLTAVARFQSKPTTNVFELFSPGCYRTQMPLAVGTESLMDVPISVDAGAEVVGHLNVPAPDARVQFDGGPDWQITAFVHGDQTFLTNLARGHYNLDRTILPGYIVSSVLLDGRDILDDGLSIAGPGKLSLEFVLSKDGGQIDGVVADKDGKPVPGATVVLVPEQGRRSHADLFQEVDADQQGRYRIEAISPGKYRLFAWDDVEPGIWWDPDFLRHYEDKGEPVSIQPGSHEVKNLTSAGSR